MAQKTLKFPIPKNRLEYAFIDVINNRNAHFSDTTNRLSAPIGASSRYLSSSNILSECLLPLSAQSQAELRFRLRKTSSEHLAAFFVVFLSAKIRTYSSIERRCI